LCLAWAWAWSCKPRLPETKCCSGVGLFNDFFGHSIIGSEGLRITLFQYILFPPGF
jgi:hypothetical protein